MVFFLINHWIFDFNCVYLKSLILIIKSGFISYFWSLIFNFIAVISLLYNYDRLLLISYFFFIPIKFGSLFKNSFKNAFFLSLCSLKLFFNLCKINFGYKKLVLVILLLKAVFTNDFLKLVVLETGGFGIIFSINALKPVFNFSSYFITSREKILNLNFKVSIFKHDFVSQLNWFGSDFFFYKKNELLWSKKELENSCSFGLSANVKIFLKVLAILCLQENCSRERYGLIFDGIPVHFLNKIPDFKTFTFTRLKDAYNILGFNFNLATIIDVIYDLNCSLKFKNFNIQVQVLKTIWNKKIWCVKICNM